MTPLETWFGIESKVKPMKGLTREELALLEARTGFALPSEVRELLTRCSGFSTGDWNVHLGGFETGAFEFPSVSPRGVVIASSGEGNFWLVDVTADGWGPVLYFSHDPPVAVRMSSDLASFIETAANPRCVQQARDAAREAWGAGDASAADVTALKADADSSIAAFAAEMPSHGRFFDLRKSASLPFDLYGNGTAVRRAGEKLVFWVGDISQEIIAFVARELSVSKERLRLSTKLGKDLGVDGDDGQAFIARFGESFGVDLAAFKPADYFGPEGLSPWWPLSPRWWRERRKLKEISISDLVSSAREGAWIAKG